MTLSFVFFTKILQQVRTMKISKFVLLYGGTEANQQMLLDIIEMKRKFIYAALQIVDLLMTNASILMTFQKLFPDNFIFAVADSPGGMAPLSYDNAVYFLVITTATIGYGDIAPVATLSRCVVLMIIIVSITIITMQTSALSELVLSSTQYLQPFRDKYCKHVIIAGNCANVLKLRQFLHEFYLKGNQKTKCVIIDDNDLPKETLDLFTSSKYAEQIHYIKGNVFDPHTLSLANAANAEAAFILADQYSPDENDDDEYAVLSAKALSNYNRQVKIFSQVVQEQYLLHSWCNWNMAMSFDELKHALFCMNVFNPGFITFVMNIMVTKEKVSRDDSPGNWFYDYSEGAKRNIFTRKVSTKFAGKTFIDVVRRLYIRYYVLTVAIYSAEYNEIFINPVNHQLKENDMLIMLALNEGHADSVFDKAQRTPEFQAQISRNKLHLTTPVKNALFNKKITSTHNYDLKVPPTILNKNVYNMLNDDLRGVLRGHILIFAPVEHVGMIVAYLRYFTRNYVCYVSEHAPGPEWSKIAGKYQRVIYAECMYPFVSPPI
ncbi:MAG: potassium channel subfamily T member [Candidatus Pacebacteria bacterium]|nr:potassium channel subfamily T member [Candidatus Paceibacterota bacterium]